MSAESTEYDFQSILDAAETASSDSRSAYPPARLRDEHRPTPESFVPVSSDFHPLASALVKPPSREFQAATPASTARTDVVATAQVSPTTRGEEFCEKVAAHLDACGFGNLQVSVNRGLITLSGVVASQYEKSLAIDYVRRYAKVSGVSDQLRISPQQQRDGLLPRAAGFAIDVGQAAIDWAAAIPRSAWCIIAASLVLAIVAWWRPSQNDPHLAVYPVSGTVLVDGRVPAGAQIVLHPRGHQLPEGSAATATVHEDGSFSVSIYGDELGVPPGEYIATVHWFAHLGSESQGQRNGLEEMWRRQTRADETPSVPEIYTSPDSSPLRVTVRKNQNELTPIVISCR